jgi:hypothetical protein
VEPVPLFLEPYAGTGVHLIPIGGGEGDMSPLEKGAQGRPQAEEGPMSSKVGSDKAGGTHEEQSERLLRQRALSDNLRTIFHGIADESVPDQMLKLLDELDAKGPKK